MGLRTRDFRLFAELKSHASRCPNMRLGRLAFDSNFKKPLAIPKLIEGGQGIDYVLCGDGDTAESSTLKASVDATLPVAGEQG